jgi:hypothetical protein
MRAGDGGRRPTKGGGGGRMHRPAVGGHGRPVRFRGQGGGFRGRLGRYPVLLLSPASALAFPASVRELGFSTRDTRRSYLLRTEAHFRRAPPAPPPHPRERSKSRRKRVGGRMRRWAAVGRGRRGDARSVIQSKDQEWSPRVDQMVTEAGSPRRPPLTQGANIATFCSPL